MISFLLLIVALLGPFNSEVVSLNSSCEVTQADPKVLANNISPDRAHLLYLDVRERAYMVVEIDEGGEPKGEPAYVVSIATWPVWSPSGGKLAFMGHIGSFAEEGQQAMLGIFDLSTTNTDWYRFAGLNGNRVGQVEWVSEDTVIYEFGEDLEILELGSDSRTIVAQGFAPYRDRETGELYFISRSGQSHSVSLLDLNGYVASEKFELGEFVKVNNVAWSQDFLAISYKQGSSAVVQVVSLGSGLEVSRFEVQDSNVNLLSWSPDGSILFFASGHGDQSQVLSSFAPTYETWSYDINVLPVEAEYLAISWPSVDSVQLNVETEAGLLSYLFNDNYPIACA